MDVFRPRPARAQTLPPPARRAGRPRRVPMAFALASPALVAGAIALMVSGLSPATAVATVHTSAVVATVPTTQPTTTTTTAPPPTTTTTAPPPTTTTPPPPPPPPPPPAPAAVPPEGQATAYGCGPALAYLAAYAAPGFKLVCPGDSQGHQATTCISAYPCAPGEKMIIITVPCAAAYMNEAHNSWAVQDGGSIDPYGYCH